VQAERDEILVRVQVAGQARLASARVCLLACGARYRFQQALGWGPPPLLFSSAQTEVAAPARSELEVFFPGEVAPAGFAWLVPVRRGEEGRAKVGVIAARRPTRALARLLDDLRRAGRVSRFQGPVIVRPAPLSPLRRTYGDGILAIGDAAGMVKPTTGGGIYYGLLSAGWAAETVKRAFDRGDFSAATLAAYEETWRARLGPELTIGVWFRRLVARLAPSDLDALTQLALTDGVMPIVRTTARFNWHRDLILQLLRHPGVLQLLLRRLVAAPSAFEGTGAPRRVPRPVGT
jgi:flavin-dependent dehydrogenase